MNSQELLDTLLEVAARQSGRPISDVYAAASRPYDDPSSWKRSDRAHQDSLMISSSKSDIDALRRRHQRISTRKSRLIARLCEQITLFEIQRGDMADSRTQALSYYQQLMTVQILQQNGHTAQAMLLARRILQRATGAGESTMALLAGDLIDQLCGKGSDPGKQLKFIAQQRKWSDIDHRRRRRDLLAEELLVGKRHRTDATYIDELSRAEDELKMYVDQGRAVSRDAVVKAVVIQRLLREGRNDEVVKATSSAFSTLHNIGHRTPTWLEVWFLTARVRALTGQGAFGEVIDITRRIDKHWLVRTHLSHEFLRHRLMAEMKLGNWNKAQFVLAEIDTLTDHQTDILDIERRMLIASYMHLARELGICPISVTGMPKRLSSLIGSVDVITDDRKGLGALVLIHDAIQSFLCGDADVAERKVLNLQVYASRNLREPGTGALRGFVSFLRMLIVHRVSFLENPQRLKRFADKLASEYDGAYEQAVCPLPLTQLMGALAEVVVRRRS